MLFKAFAAAIIGYLLVWSFYKAEHKLLPISQTPTATTTVNTATISPVQETATTTVRSITATTTVITKKTATIVPKTTKPITTPVTPKVIAPTPTPAVIPQAPAADFEAINTFARSALVNILCTAGGNDLSPISGSGIIVSPDGLILTNAHVAEFLLIKDYRVPNYIKCIIRTGSPAYPAYNAELVYISPAWVNNNKALLKENNPTGTGVNDYAFIRITGKINGSPVSSLPYIEPSVEEVNQLNEPVLLVSYPAGFLGGVSILQNLSVVSAVTRIKEFMTFDNTSVDVISVPGTVVSQKGSSGGGVVDANKKLIGIISTSSEGSSTSDRDLRAITTAYINRDLQDNLGVTLSHFITQDSAVFAKTFQTNTAPALSKLIIDELNKQ